MCVCARARACMRVHVCVCVYLRADRRTERQKRHINSERGLGTHRGNTEYSFWCIDTHTHTHTHTLTFTLTLAHTNSHTHTHARARTDVVLQDTKTDVGARNERHLVACFAGLTDGFEVIHAHTDMHTRTQTLAHAHAHAHAHTGDPRAC